MKLPTDVSGQELIRLLLKVGFVVNRQRGSHVVLRRREDEAKAQTPEAAQPEAATAGTEAQPTQQDQYKALFDEADKREATRQKRAAQGAPAIPEEGVPDTRPQLAQRLEGKPWADVSNSEAATIDNLVRQGYGSAQRRSTRCNRTTANCG